ncbi:hypothetical protein Tco_0223220 [Tanacetum coccineum]
MLKSLNSKPGDLATKFISVAGKPMMARRSVTYTQPLRDESVKLNVEQPSQHDDCDTMENAGSPQLDNEDLDQIDTDDLEEMVQYGRWPALLEGEEILNIQEGNLKFPMAKETIGFDKTKMGSRESDVDDSPVNDRFKIGEGFHAVPPPYTRNYMPSRPDLSFVGLDDSVYKTKVSETETSISKTSKDIVEKPKTVRPSAPIIEDWDTDSDNDSVFRPKSDQTKPKFTKINFVKSDENVKSVNKENTHRQVEYPRKSQSPRDNRRN